MTIVRQNLRHVGNFRGSKTLWETFRRFLRWCFGRRSWGRRVCASSENFLYFRKTIFRTVDAIFRTCSCSFPNIHFCFPNWEPWTKVRRGASPPSNFLIPLHCECENLHYSDLPALRVIYLHFKCETCTASAKPALSCRKLISGTTLQKFPTQISRTTL